MIKRVTLGPKKSVGVQARDNPLKLVHDGFLEFGEYYRLPIIPGISWYVISDPLAVEQVLVKNYKNYEKPKIFTNSLRHLTGSGIISSDQNNFIQSRKKIVPIFQMKMTSKMNSNIHAIYDEVLKSSLPSTFQEVELFSFMQRTNFKVYTRLFLGEDLCLDTEMGKKLQELFDFVHYKMHHPISTPMWINSPRNVAFKKNKKSFDLYIQEQVLKRIRRPHEFNDILADYIKTFDGEAEILKEGPQIIDEIYTLLFAGHDTVGTHMAWYTYLLSQHSDVKARLNETLQSGDETYFKMVMNETLRLYPAAWSIPRTCGSEDIINNYIIPKSVMIILPIYSIQRNPLYWDDPNTFNPERFLTPLGAERRYNFLPFGIGPRMCFGNNMTSLMGKELMTTLLRNYDFETVTQNPFFELNGKSTIRAQGGIRLKITKK